MYITDTFAEEEEEEEKTNTKKRFYITSVVHHTLKESFFFCLNSSDHVALGSFCLHTERRKSDFPFFFRKITGCNNFEIN